MWGFAMSDFSWLHFSDLHFSPREGFNTKRARDALLRCIKVNKLFPTYIFITGDIANKANYIGASEYLNDLFTETKVVRERVFWAVGNHDISREGKVRASIIKGIRNATDSSAEFESSMADDETRNLLTVSGMSAYIEQYEKLLGYKLLNNELPHRLIHLPELNLIVLNTCLTSCDNADEQKLYIVEAGLDNVFDGIDIAKPTIAIGHHGRSFLARKDQDELGMLFEDNGVDFYLCGHEHRLGRDIFPATERVIPELICGGGVFDSHSQFVFMHGRYNDSNYSVTVTPYSYSESTAKWDVARNLHRRFGENERFIIHRRELNQPTKSTAQTDNTKDKDTETASMRVDSSRAINDKGSENVTLVKDNLQEIIEVKKTERDNKSNQNLWTEHPEAATTYNNTANKYYEQGKYGDALEWYNKALAINEKVLGTEHPDTASTYNNIAYVYDNQGKYYDALVWHEKALLIREKVLGTEHLDTATTYNNIANVYADQGKYDDALELYKKALTIREKELGTEHPDTAKAYWGIAYIYNNQLRYNDALEWYMKALFIFEKVLGTEHPNTAAIYNNIAWAYNNQGKYDDALTLYQKALGIYEKVLGETHPFIIKVYNNISDVYHEMGKPTEAQKWAAKAKQAEAARAKETA